MAKRRPRLEVLIRSMQKDLSSLKKAGGRALAKKARIKTVLKRLKKDLRTLDDTADGCGYTLTGD